MNEAIVKKEQDLIKEVCSQELLVFLQKNKARNVELETTAKAIKSFFKFDTHPINVEKIEFKHLGKIATTLNIELGSASEKEMPKSIFGLLTSVVTKEGSHRNVILVREKIRKTTARFRICHELAHYILGHKPIDINMALTSFSGYRNYLKNEYEANYLAGAILIDDEKLINLYNKEVSDITQEVRAGKKKKEDIGGVLSSIMPKFGVSYETIARRFVVALPFDVHFIKSTRDGIILQKYSSYKEPPLPNTSTKTCQNWLARRVFQLPEDSAHWQVTELFDQNSRKKVKKLFCAARIVEKENGEKYAITLGCNLDKAPQIFSEYTEGHWFKASLNECPGMKLCTFGFCRANGQSE